jgi:hypothetical protein
MKKPPEPLKDSLSEEGGLPPMMGAFFGTVVASWILYAILDSAHCHPLTVAIWHVRAGVALATLLVVGDVIVACRAGAGLLVSRETSLPILPLYWLYWFVAWPGALVAVIVAALSQVRPVAIAESLAEGKRGGEVAPMEEK